jgi:hypothetical protein
MTLSAQTTLDSHTHTRTYNNKRTEKIVGRWTCKRINWWAVISNTSPPPPCCLYMKRRGWQYQNVNWLPIVLKAANTWWSRNLDAKCSALTTSLSANRTRKLHEPTNRQWALTLVSVCEPVGWLTVKIWLRPLLGRSSRSITAAHHGKKVLVKVLEK